MSDIRKTGVQATREIESLIDVAFYSREADIAFCSTEEAARHFLSLGQARNLSPSPFLFWGWVRSQNPDLADLRHVLAHPSRICAHPAFSMDLFAAVCDVVKGGLPGVLGVLSRLLVDRAPLLPGFAAAARARHERHLRPFLTALSARRLDGPGLEMPLFSSAWYVDTYDDVASAGLNPFPHYVLSGWKEGRDPSPKFSTKRYLERHPDVARSGRNPLIHYLDLGEAQARAVDRSTA